MLPVLIRSYKHFNPRSLAGATKHGVIVWVSLKISIHAPLRERRYRMMFTLLHIAYFNPRSLAGATSTKLIIYASLKFQSTLPCGSDRGLEKDLKTKDLISIHAPLRERLVVLLTFFLLTYFNPRSLAGATLVRLKRGVCIMISIHAPLRERLLVAFLVIDLLNFNPRSLAGATGIVVILPVCSSFQSTLPCGSDLPI